MPPSTKQDLKLLERLHWKVRTNCSLSCNFCYLWRRQNKTSISFETSKLLIKEASKLFQWILLGGGDPLLHPKIIELAMLSKKNGLNVELQTNATAINAEWIPKLFDYVDLFGISIDSAHWYIHDQMRGAAGSFNQQIRALELATSNNLKTTVRTLITRQNMNSLGNIPVLLSSFPCVGEWKIRQFIPLGRGKRNRSFYNVSDSQFHHASEQCKSQAERIESSYKVTVAFAESVSIDCCVHINHDGTVYGNPVNEKYKTVGSFPQESLISLIFKVIPSIKEGSLL